MAHGLESGEDEGVAVVAGREEPDPVNLENDDGALGGKIVSGNLKVRVPAVNRITKDSWIWSVK